MYRRAGHWIEIDLDGRICGDQLISVFVHRIRGGVICNRPLHDDRAI
jgi:hypothetical protein